VNGIPSVLGFVASRSDVVWELQSIEVNNSINLMSVRSTKHIIQ